MANHLHRLVISFFWVSLAACPKPPQVATKATQIAPGSNHTCALLDNGDVTCWGNNFFGQLGVGNTESVEDPSLGSNVVLGGKATQVVSGFDFSCALLDTGGVRCWGLASLGELGYANTDDIGDDETPASVGDIDLGGKATQITSGAAHACALLESGNVRCWGSSLNGKLGYGNLNNIGDDETPASAGDVELGQPAIQISAGGGSTCALFGNGGVRCWGPRRALGQDDNNGFISNVGDDETPIVLPDIDLGAKAIQIDAGFLHTCALLEGGDVRCWGIGLDGQLGVVGELFVGVGVSPTTVDVIDLGGKATAIEAGSDHTCALLDSGDVKCWGDAERGTLGLGNDESIGVGLAPSSIAPINLGGKVTHLASGFETNCAILEDNTVRCWGNNDNGQLGTGALNHIGDDETPASAGDIDLGGTAVQLNVGWAYSCAILDTGAVRCWGDNSVGQNGYGIGEDIGDNELPSAVGELPLGGKAIQLSTRDFQTCALLDTGGVRCWGKNNIGSLGYGDIGPIGDDETPADLGDLDLLGAATEVALGGEHACAIMDTGSVRCWGLNFFGELGYGNTDTIGDDESPGAGGDLDLGGTAAHLAAGVGFTCALLDTGNVRCWGVGSTLGQGNTNPIGDDETPASVGDIDLGGTAVQLVAGDFHVCAILSTGNVRCWGSNRLGQLGYGNLNNIGDDETPAFAGDVPLGGKVAQLSAHESSTCALLDTGAVRCWGLNTSGELGYPNESEIIGDDETPADVGDIDLGGIAAQISNGVFHTCALLDTGAVRCWGLNTDGELGYGNDSDVGDSELPIDSVVKLF